MSSTEDADTNKRLPRVHGIHLLRAVAVSAVVVYHFFPNALRGGFLGVDIFFVISGFLITGIIRHAAHNEGFLRTFYLRRIKRLLPALLLVLATVAALSVWLLTDAQQTNLAKSTASALFFGANIYFSFNTGYFDPDVYTRPLLHLWSLGVEEQFYLIWPAFLIVLNNRVKAISWWLVLVVVVGAVFSQCLTSFNASFAFYWMPARVFQFALGALVYELFNSNQMRLPGSTFYSHSLLIIGLALIFYSFFSFNEAMPMPGWRALIPSTGAAIVIYTCLASQIDESDWMQAGVIRWLGNISYSAYLWHWPVAVFAYVYFGDQLPDTQVRILLISATATIATLTFYYVEKPCIETDDSRTILVILGLGIIGLLSFTVVSGLFKNSVQQDEVSCSEHPLLTERKHCYYKPTEPDSGTTVIWGDSHAGHFIQMAKVLAVKTGRGAIVYNVCLPIPDGKKIFVNNAKNPKKATDQCVQSTNLLMDAIVNDKSIDNVWLSGGWLYLGDVYAEGELESMSKKQIAKAGVKKSIERLKSTRVDVHLISQFPFGFTAYKCVGAHAAEESSNTGNCPPNSRGAVDRKFSWSNEWLQAISLDTGVPIHDLAHTICNTETCPTHLEGEALYRDSNHLRIDLRPRTVDRLVEVLDLERRFRTDSNK